MDNTAVVGGDVYGKVEACSWLPPLFNCNNTGLSLITFDCNEMSTSPLLTPTDKIKLLNESVCCHS